MTVSAFKKTQNDHETAQASLILRIKTEKQPVVRNTAGELVELRIILQSAKLSKLWV